MALPPQGLITFPGIVFPRDGRYTCSHGINPGRAIIRAAFQDTPVLNVGDMQISYGNQAFVVRDCKVTEQVNYYDPDGGWVSEYLLEDRRWRWRFGEIEGHYNRRIKAGKLIDDCKKTPQELAELLFKAMKEQNYDFSELPNGVYPEVEWVGANPAQELERLADSLGCRVVYDPLTDSMRLRRGGEGAFLPFLDSVDNVGSNDVVPALPSGIRVVGGTTRVQAALELKTPLMEDLDGELKDPRDLSFVADLVADTGKTAFTWFESEGAEFSNITDLEQRKLAQKTMWRYYKVDAPSNDIESYFKVTSLQAENVSLELNEEYTLDNGEKSKQGYVLGEFNNLDFSLKQFGGFWVAKNTSTANNDTRYEGNIQIVNELDFPYIIFDRPVFKWDQDTDGNDIKAIPTKLYLICTFEVRNESQNQTCSLHHYNYLYQIGSDAQVGPEVYHDDSLVLLPIEDFDNDNLTRSGNLIRDNIFRDQLDVQSKEISESRARRYQNVSAGNATYQQFILINLDGAIQSVTWRFDENGAVTEAYRNSEPDYVETKYDRRLRLNEIKRKAGVP